MSRIKKNKFEKLQKMRVWPSVLFFCFALLIAMIAYFALIAFVVINQAQERFSYAFYDAAKVIDAVDRSEGKETDVVQWFQMTEHFSDAIFVYDRDGAQIFGCGEATYLTGSEGDSLEEFSAFLSLKPRFPENSRLLPDTTPEINLVNQSGVLHFDYIFQPEIISKFQDAEINSNDVVLSARFWIRSELAGGRTILVKCIAPLYLYDFEKALAAGTGVAAAMVFPVLFFFINVLVSVHGQRRVTRLLYTDAVTAGNSYVYYEHGVRKAAQSYRNYGKTLMVVDMTIMKYRSYCNYYGVRAGEKLLGEVDREISARLGRKEICAHSAKASFALLLGCDRTEGGRARVDGMVRELTEHFKGRGIVFHAGICELAPDKTARRLVDPADCLNRAGAARAMLTDENVPSVAVYDDKLIEEQRWEHRVEEKMQAALDNEEFQVYIQPKYDPVSEVLVGAEALIRWTNEEDGFISPGRFIPIFEKNGFITKIDDYMISHVAKLQADWLAKGKQVVPISVNVSRAHFADPNLAEHISSLVDRYEVPHHLIEIELTESAFFDNKDALLRTVRKLREAGFEISMDDFGAGYSSLNSLKELPLDVLKLDAEFFRGSDEENRGEVVVAQAIQLAKNLHMRIVAEGIEKKEQVDFLAQAGCDMIQGFYFAKPMPAGEYAERLPE